jgi:ribonucleotide reductase beta subunit family protein with ferritin-like domain
LKVVGGVFVRFSAPLQPVSLIGMNSGLMKQYLEFVVDGLLVQLKCEKNLTQRIHLNL